MTRRRTVIEWYRPRLLGRLTALWLVAVALLTVGVLGAGMAMDSSGRVPEEWRGVAMVAGVAGTVLGAVGGIVGILKLVSEDDRYLLVSVEGIEVSAGGAPVFIAWARLVAARAERGRLVLQPADGPEIRVRDAYQGARADALAARLLDCKRKALLGVLKPPKPAPRHL